MENINFICVVSGNKLEITPVPASPGEAAILDNSIYEIKIDQINNIGATKGISDLKFKVATKLSPAFCTITAVSSIVGEYGISDDLILYFIKEASAYTNWVKEQDETNLEYAAIQLTKYKAAYDSLLSSYMQKAIQFGNKGQIGDVIFDKSSRLNDIKDALKALKDLEEEWKDALLGFIDKGPAKPKSVVKGFKPNTSGGGILSSPLSIDRGL